MRMALEKKKFLEGQVQAICIYKEQKFDYSNTIKIKIYTKDKTQDTTHKAYKI